MRFARLWAALAIVIAPVAAFGGDTPHVTLATPNISDGAITRFTVRFSDAIVPLGDPRAASPLKVECAVPGDGRWADPQTYVWDFAQPLPGGTRCTLATRDGLKSAAGYAVDADSFTVDAGGPVARAVMPGYGDIEEDQVFLVAANMPATRMSIAANAYCAVDGIGEKIAVDVLAPDLPAKLLAGMGKSYQVGNFLENAGLPKTLPSDPALRQRALAGVTALKCRRPLPPGRDMALVWGANIASAGGKLAGADQRFDFTVRKPFTARFECSRVNTAAGCSPVEKAYLRFSAPIPMSAATAIRLTLADGKTIAPVIADDDKRRATIEQVTFVAPLPVATRATLSIPADLKDESGRILANRERFPLEVKFDEAPPLVKFAADFGILEAKQGGVLPVTVRNVEPSLQGQTAGIGGQRLRVAGTDGEIAAWLRQVEEAGKTDVQTIERKGAEPIQINHTGEKPILFGSGSGGGGGDGGAGDPFKLDLPGKGKDFEVVGLPLGKPGFYVVELASPRLGRALLGRNVPRYVASAALVTDLAVHFEWGRDRSLAWVTRLSTGKPVANAVVQVSDSCTGKPLARGATDKSGGLMVARGLPEPETYGSCKGEGGAHPLMISARSGDDFSFTLTDWGEGIRPYDFDLPYGYSAATDIIHTVFDRALVRQGETIHMKHILRRPDARGFSLAPGFMGTLRLSHRGSDTQFEMPVTIGANGTGETVWTAPKGAPMGDYDLVFVVGDTTTESAQSFKVDEYRLPTMRASVTGPKTALVKPRTAQLDLFAGYLSGGGASNLPVDVRIGWFAHSATPVGYDKYSFGGDAISEGVKPLDGEGEDAKTPLPPTQMLPATLGTDGTRRMTVDMPQTLPGTADMQIEMDYRDANGETLTASKSIPIYASAVQLGVATDGWMMRADDLRLNFVALDTDGKPIKGQKLSVALYSREILTARRRLIGGFYAYDNRMRTTKLSASCSATTDAKGQAQCKVDPGVSGELYAVVTTSDADGNVARSVKSVWLAGDDDWWFGGDNGDRMDVVPEKLAYASGETARFQVRMPFRSATALVSVQREGVLSSFVTELSGKDPVVEVPMDAAYAPDVYVSVLVVRGRVESGFWSWVHRIARTLGLSDTPEDAAEPTALVDLAKPAYRLGIAKVKVGWEGHTLGVVVKADRERYAPRGTANVMVQVKKPDGSPAREADVAFAAVDKALLQLAPNDSWNILEAMMGDRPLSVLTSTAQMQVVGKRHYGRKALEAGGGGGGGDLSGLNRENFQPVLLWKGHVPLDSQGRARVTVPLSDALSSFQLVAIATDGAQAFGTGSTDIRTAQDLSLYAGLPPLVRSGDFYGARFTLRNGSDHPMTVTATVDVFPRIAQGKPLTVTIPAGGAAPVAWNLTAPAGIDTLRWHVSAKSDDGRAGDQLTVTQDVIPAVPTEIWAATLAQVGEATTIPIAPPAGALPGRGSVDIRLADTLAPSLAGVRDYMARYPFNCLEQRLSRIIVLGDMAGWTSLAGEIPTYQAPDGLLRYFPGDSLQGSEALTAYVLSIAGAANLSLPPVQRARMIEAMKAVLDGRLRREDYGDVRLTKIAALSALARQGEATPAMLGQIGMTPADMPTASLADYIAALGAIPGTSTEAKAQAEAVLRSRLVFEGTRLDLSDSANASWWLMSSADEAANKVTAAVLGRPGWQDDAPRLMVGTALRQSRGHWDTTTANAWGAIAARRFAQIYPAQAVTGATMLSYGGRSISRGWPLAEAARSTSFPLAAAGPLRLAQAGGAGPWATVSVSAAVPLRQPLFAGYRLTRKVDVVQARNAARLTTGDVLRVTLTVEATAERNWVAISDPVPAGATVIGDLGGQSQMLQQGGESEGRGPSYVERGRDTWRAYFAWLPKGTATVSYTLRLNGAGRFQLPPSRVEAMYSPAIHAAVPNQPMVVADR
ncbi:MG2 domain-containing protein [Sphingomonas sp. 4RDLI-65]|uniref:alpha-2-macroglobulin family protein n=1 Tax=Sphingomonas sp. 4RDLI-65 TaxID=3111641 RepID=UPI003C200B01